MEHRSPNSPLSRWLETARRRIYTPLDPDGKEIRLLKLHPTAKHGKDGPLRCTLVHYALQGTNGETLEYETVSYAWGDPTPTAKIVVNDLTLLFPRETQKALRRLRLRDRPRLLWIDAVCIDQSNTVERGQQVAIMADVYRQGSRNLVYLGEDNDGTAVDAARSLQDVYDGETRQDTDDFTKLRSTLNNSDHHFLLSDTPLRTSVNKKALKSFFAVPWFEYVSCSAN